MLQSKNSFNAGLFVMALCALLVGSIELFDYVDFRMHAQQATMRLANPEKRIISYSDDLTYRPLDVIFVSDAGEVAVSNKSVENAMAERLIAGDSIPLVYMTNNPRK